MRPRTAAVDALVETISAERDVVEYLAFKLITLKLLFVADEGRFVEKAAAEAEKVIDSLRVAERHRDRAVEAVAAEWDIRAADLTLERLARETTGEVGDAIARLRTVFAGLADEIEQLLEENRALAESGLNNVRSLLDAVADSTGAELYTDRGRRDRTHARPVKLDRVL
jgi:hypothetical protein